MKLPGLIRCPSVMDGDRCDGFRFHWTTRHVHHGKAVTRSWGRHADRRETYETDAPWVTWTWLSTDRETRFTGRMRMLLTCCICGKRETIRIPIPRFGPVPTPEGGVHPEREQAKVRHAHPAQRNPVDWALPLRNPAAFPAGIPLDIFKRVAETAVIEAEERRSADPGDFA